MINIDKFEENKMRLFPMKLKGLIDQWEKKNGKKLSQEALADAIDGNRVSIHQWMNGKAYPSNASIQKLCKFFVVHEGYFSDAEGLTLYSEDQHKYLNSVCEQFADEMRLSKSFVQFIKENQALSDAVISASWVGKYEQSFDPAVPDMQDENIFQFVASSGSKIYPSREVLQMLRLVQCDLEKHAALLIEHYSKIIQERDHSRTGVVHRVSDGMGGLTYADDKGKELTFSADYFALREMGREDLTRSESHLVDIYRNMDEKHKQELQKQVRYINFDNRKSHEIIPDSALEKEADLDEKQEI